jgi:hypothetical protein
MSGVIWVAGEDCECAVELLGHYEARKSVGHSHGPERKQQLRPRSSSV